MWVISGCGVFLGFVEVGILTGSCRGGVWTEVMRRRRDLVEVGGKETEVGFWKGF